MSIDKDSLNHGGSQAVKLPGGKIVGCLVGDTFVKVVCGSRHKLKNPEAWAIDAEAFDQQIKPLAKHIRVEDRETGTIWEISVSDFDRYKGVLNRGFGRQYFLRLNRWNCKLSRVETPDLDTVRKAEQCCQIRLIS
jgi:hypothetical protein